jgi:hypothetical protein
MQMLFHKDRLLEFNPSIVPGAQAARNGVPRSQRTNCVRRYVHSVVPLYLSLILRQAIESMYMLWRTTGDSKWRNKGWAIFEAIDQHARLEHGFASIKDAMATTVVHGNDMPSWFLAET